MPAGDPLIAAPPPPPEVRGATAKRAWVEITSAMIERGTLTLGDLPLVTLVCDARQRLARAYRLVDREGLILKGGTMDRLHPAEQDAADLRRFIRQCYADLGLTPTSSSKVRGGEKRQQQTEAEAGLERYGIRGVVG